MASEREELAEATEAVWQAMRVQMGASCPSEITARIYAREFAQAALAAAQPAPDTSTASTHGPDVSTDRQDVDTLAAVEAEREACARVAEAAGRNAASALPANDWGRGWQQGAIDTGAGIAAAIRARATRPDPGSSPVGDV